MTGNCGKIREYRLGIILMTGTTTKSGCGTTLLILIGILGVIGIGFVGCVAIIGNSYLTQEKETKGTAIIDDTSWVPAGFDAYNNKVAWKWSEDSSYKCSYGDSCVQVEVVSKDGCESLYVELTKVDEAGNNVGYTNETTTNLITGQKAILLFNLFGDFKSLKLSKISCY